MVKKKLYLHQKIVVIENLVTLQTSDSRYIDKDEFKLLSN